MIKEFYWYYIAYDELNKALKIDFVSPPTPANPKPDRRPWTEDDEQRFVALLESELDKVFNFQRLKSEEIVRRIQAIEKDVNDVVSRMNRAALDARHPSDHRPAALLPSDEDFLLLEQVLSDIIADVHDLAKFTQLNYTGFQKIVKKHDVRCCVSGSWYAVLANSSRLIETNRLVSETGLCRTAKREALFQGQLRCFCGETLKAVRSGPQQGRPRQG